MTTTICPRCGAESKDERTESQRRRYDHRCSTCRRADERARNRTWVGRKTGLKLGTPEFSQYMSKVRKASPAFQAALRKTQDGLRGKKASPETCAALSAAQRASYTPERREATRRLGLNSKGRRYSGVALENIRAAAKDPARRAKLGQSQRARWAALSHEEKIRLTTVPLSKAHANPSSIERIVRALLDQLGVTYQTQVRIGRYSADILIAEKNLVIECDGKYWHGSPEQKAADARRDDFMIAKGYSVMRLPECEIRSGAFRAALLKVVA